MAKKIRLEDHVMWLDSYGQVHRKDGPAIIYDSGEKHWYKRGSLHRKDGPAVITYIGGIRKWWYRNGKLHRTDGPAIEGWENRNEYWVEGTQYTKEQFETLSFQRTEDDRIVWRTPLGRLHRIDGPAIVHSSGLEYWYNDDKLHRMDGPAIKYESGNEEYWINGIRYTKEEFENQSSPYTENSRTIWRTPLGQVHRTDGPAVVYPDGLEIWYVNGKRHREDGPAMVWPNGTEWWYRNDRLHREDGPAMIDEDGTQNYYLEGKGYSKEEFYQKVNPPAEPNYVHAEILADGKIQRYTNTTGLLHRTDGPAYIVKGSKEEWYHEGQRHRVGGPAIAHENGAESWYQNSLAHREDGPAITTSNGDKHWLIKGKLHREDGPAIIREDGAEFWYVNDRLHREDGPAITHPGGIERYFLNAKEYSKEEFYQKVNPPAETNYVRHLTWCGGDVQRYYNVDRELHRTDGPAHIVRANWVINQRAREEWWINGKLHREDGPAIVYEDGEKHWFINGNELTEEEFNARNKPVQELVDAFVVYEFDLYGNKRLVGVYSTVAKAREVIAKGYNCRLEIRRGIMIDGKVNVVDIVATMDEDFQPNFIPAARAALFSLKVHK